MGEVKAFVKSFTEADKRDADLSKEIALQAPAFPQAGKGSTVSSDMIPTYAYNWCVSPMTPMAVSGVIWVPSEHNLGEDPAHYAAELEIYARSLPATYGQERIQFIYAQPTAQLVQGITMPDIPGAKSVTFEAWPKTLKEIASRMAKMAE